jgi:hypothetical protein
MKTGRDILSGYGPDASKPQRASASCGGVLPKDVKPIPYSPPQGPIGISRVGVGLGGVNHGNNPQKASPSRGSGSPGIGGSNRGNDGTQR